jgi:hypothetical protein
MIGEGRKKEREKERKEGKEGRKKGRRRKEDVERMDQSLYCVWLAVRWN